MEKVAAKGNRSVKHPMFWADNVTLARRPNGQNHRHRLFDQSGFGEEIGVGDGKFVGVGRGITIEVGIGEEENDGEGTGTTVGIGIGITVGTGVGINVGFRVGIGVGLGISIITIGEGHIYSGIHDKPLGQGKHDCKDWLSLTGIGEGFTSVSPLATRVKWRTPNNHAVNPIKTKTFFIKKPAPGGWDTLGV